MFSDSTNNVNVTEVHADIGGRRIRLIVPDTEKWDSAQRIWAKAVPTPRYMRVWALEVMAHQWCRCGDSIHSMPSYGTKDRVIPEEVVVRHLVVAFDGRDGRYVAAEQSRCVLQRVV
jgi:hypothetical protein